MKVGCVTRIKVNGVNLHYAESGSGRETIVFAHGLLMNHQMFSGQVEALSADYRCVAYDHRGQGGSEVAVGGYDLDNQARDAAELIRVLDAAPCHFVGLSMGGFVGLRLALHYPGLLRSLTLIGTSADPEPARALRKYRAMILVARWFGFRPLSRSVTRLMFAQSFLQDPDHERDREFWKQQTLTADRTGLLRAAEAVITREGVHERLGDIGAPTLILVGEEDTVTPVSRAQRMHAGIADSRLVLLPRTGHSSTIEQPAAVSAELAAFLASAAARAAESPVEGRP